MMRNLLLLVVAIAAFSTSAAEPPINLAKTALSTAAFFQHAAYRQVEISPSGNHVAAVALVDDKYYLVVMSDLNKNPPTVTAIFGIEGNVDVHSFYWFDEDRLLFDTASNVGGLDRPRLHDDLFLASADRKEFHALFNSGYTSIVSDVLGNNDTVIAAVGRSAVSINLKSGYSKSIAFAGLYGVSYFADHHGNVRIAVGNDDDDVKNIIKIRKNETFDTWEDVVVEKQTFQGLRPISGVGFSADDKLFYYIADSGGSTSGVFALNLSTGESHLLFRDSRYDLNSKLIGRDNKTPIGVRYGVGIYGRFYFDADSEEAKLREQLSQLFPGENVSITGYSKNGAKGILRVVSDRRPPTFYLIDLASSEVRLLIRSMPAIDNSQLSPTRLVHVVAKDGLTLDGFLTIPYLSPEKNLPLVVIPHGGPFEDNDTQDFEPIRQFLAYHGYAVLQMNFRGSSGYGRDFMQAGFREWGGKIQNDIIDSTRWAIDSGIADKNRICIFGASFGGYSALFAPLRSPGTFQCAIGYSGVYDLRTLIVEAPNSTKAFYHLTLGTDLHLLDEQSPQFHVADIAVPIFLIHGKKDSTAPFSQFYTLNEDLRYLGRPPLTLVKDQEEHGFYKLENNVELYNAILGFLQENIGDKGKASAAVKAN